MPGEYVDASFTVLEQAVARSLTTNKVCQIPSANNQSKRTSLMQRRNFVRDGLAAGATLAAAPLIRSERFRPMKKGTFVHCVYFWLKEDLTESQLKTFRSGLDALIGIDSVRHGYYGAPAGTDRPIIDRSYSYALVVVFDDKAGHDAYQVADVHDVFRQDSGSFWTEVKIYDFVVG